MERGRGRSAAICVGLAALAASVGLPGSAGASTWAPLASNTTEDITAVEYQAADRFWFVTSNGKIFRKQGATFELEHVSPGVFFNDIEFQPGGNAGLAVGDNGAVFRSTDGGNSWAALSLPAGSSSTTPNSCNTAEPPGDAESVRWANDTEVWIGASGSQIYYSSSGGATWVDQNDAGATCRISKDIDDVFPVAGTNTIYFAGKSFGSVYVSNDDLATPAIPRPAGAGNGFDGIRRLAGDPLNPSRQWAVMPGPGGGLSYTGRTTDGWGAGSVFALGEAGALPVMYDVGYAGGTVVAVGGQGTLAHSIDGATFFFDAAPGALAATEWISVDVASAAGAAAGGRGGALVVTDNANVIGAAAADTSPPETSITKKPKKKVRAKKKKVKVAFEFASSEEGSTFACTVDRKAPTPCSSPFEVKVKKGKRKFAVAATDAVGNADATPAAYSFKVKPKRKK